jgi:hypothetical protein
MADDGTINQQRARQMSNDLTRSNQANLPSLPVWLGRLAIGTVDHPGQPTRKYLAGGLSLTPNQRAEAEGYRDRMKATLSSDDPLRQRNAVLAKMIMAYPMGAGSGELGAAARAEAYLDALSDMPAWAIAEAVRRWNRGQAGEHNYSFAPAPAILRRVTDEVLVPYRIDLEKIEIVLRAVPLERAVDPEPMPKAEPEVFLPRLKRV